MWVHMLVEVRDWCLRSFSVTLLFFETVFHWAWTLPVSSRDPLPLHTQDLVLGLQTYAGARLFMWVLRSWTQVLMRTWQALHWLNYLPLVVCCGHPHPLAVKTCSSHKEPGWPGIRYMLRWVSNLQFSNSAHWVLELQAYTTVPESWQCWCYLLALPSHVLHAWWNQFFFIYIL